MNMDKKREKRKEKRERTIPSKEPSSVIFRVKKVECFSADHQE